MSRKDEQLREERRKEEERKKEIDRKESAFLAEFEQFEAFVPGAAPVRPLVEEADPFDTEIDATVLDEIELNLNLRINQKKRRMDDLLAKGFDSLADMEKQELKTLEGEIEELKDKIRNALDILVERKELGAVVFSDLEDLAQYLKESGAEDGANDALANIEKADLFGGSFAEEGEYEGDAAVIEGDSFVITEV
jgi:hypothetical protein